jgi:hypothetical protein
MILHNQSLDTLFLQQQNVGSDCSADRFMLESRETVLHPFSLPSRKVKTWIMMTNQPQETSQVQSKMSRQEEVPLSFILQLTRTRTGPAMSQKWKSFWDTSQRKRCWKT